MANAPQARKGARQENTHRAHDVAQLAAKRTNVKKYRKSVDGKDIDLEVDEKEYRMAVTQIDQAGRGGLHHPNKAARLKSRLHARLKSAATPT